MALRFRIPHVEDAEMVLGWRTSPEITQHMFSDIDDDLAGQRAWLAAALERDDYRHFLICWDDEAIGFLTITGIDWQNRHCSTGNYIHGAENQRRYAGLLHPYIMDYCFHALGMHKTLGYFMAGNQQLVKIQRILKLREVGIFRDHVRKDGAYHDVHCFELLRADWADHTHVFPRDVTLAAYEDWPVPPPAEEAQGASA